jgi:hypothetical protein
VKVILDSLQEKHLKLISVLLWVQKKEEVEELSKKLHDLLLRTD